METRNVNIINQHKRFNLANDPCKIINNNV